MQGVTGLQWCPPDVGWIKINTDGATNIEASCAGGGGVARSHLSFKGAWSKPFPGVLDPFVAEALALREGVIFAQLRGFSHVVMEVDCLEVVNLWSSRDSSRAIVAPILDEIREKSLSFISFSLRHVSREVNTLADLCAKKASALLVSECWLEDCPPFLVNSLCNYMLLRAYLGLLCSLKFNSVSKNTSQMG